MNNLFKKFVALGIIGLILITVFEIAIDIVTNFGFFLVNLVRVLEYEPKIDFLSHGFSVLILGNFITAILLIFSSIEESVHATIHEVLHYVHGAQNEIKENERYSRRLQKEKGSKK